MQKSVQARKNRIISTKSGQFQSGLPIFKTNRNTNRNLRRKIVMALFLLITYIVIFTFQIILFVITIRKKTKKLWRILFSSELIPLLISIGLMIYFNNLPGYGFMPGLTYLGEILFSFGAVVLYCISFLISICSYIAISNKQRKR